MKDEIDILIEKSFQTDYEPSKELNEKILERVQHRKRSGMLLKLPRVAAIILAITCMGSIGVYAANYIIKEVFITEHSVSTGNQDYVDDIAISSSEDAVTTENVGYEEGDENVNWISKAEQVVNDYATNTYYTYRDYETAVMDSKLDNWFTASYENAENVSYVVTKTEDILQCCINASFLYGKGRFYICEEIITGNVTEDFAYSIRLKNTNNERGYTSASGQTFTLVDQITKDGTEEVTTTFVMIAYDNYRGYISFENLKDEEIYKILDTVKLHE